MLGLEGIANFRPRIGMSWHQIYVRRDPNLLSAATGGRGYLGSSTTDTFLQSSRHIQEFRD